MKCGSQSPDHPVLKCESDKGHQGLCSVELPMGKFEWPHPYQKATSKRISHQNTSAGLKRGKGPNRASNKQGERTSFLHGIKAERLRAMAGHDRRALGIPLRRYYCEGDCGYATNDFEEAWKILTVSHIEPRNDTSTRYERRREPDFRGDDPGNILLECIPCNGKREPQPEWTETA